MGWEDLLEKKKAIHSSILAWEIPWTTIHVVAKSDFHFHISLYALKYLCIKPLEEEQAEPFSFFIWL